MYHKKPEISIINQKKGNTKCPKKIVVPSSLPGASIGHELMSTGADEINLLLLSQLFFPVILKALHPI